MLNRYIGLNNLVLFIFPILFQNPIYAKIGDKYYCEDYANSVYESKDKVSRKNWKFSIDWNRKNILLKFDNWQEVYKPKIFKQDSNFVTTFEYGWSGSGMNLFILDETNEENILTVRTSIDSNNKFASSYFSKCKKI